MNAADLVHKRTATEKRRVLDLLWRALDDAFLPYINEGICLAISGGADSRALLELVARWPGRHSGTISVVSVDHGLRAESADESAYIVARAQILAFQAQMQKLPLSKKKDESELRSLRYELLWNAAASMGCQSLATAHHKNDNVEGQLLYWLGNGGSGHGAMTSMVSTGRGALLRPFAAIESSIVHLGLNALGCSDYFLDPTNQSGGARAKVRNDLLPVLRSASGDIDERLFSLGRRSIFDRKIVDDIVEKHPLKNDGQSLSFDYTSLTVGLLSKVLLRGLRNLIPQGDLRMSYRVCEQIVNCIDPSTGSSTVKDGKERKFDFPGVRVYLSKNLISIVKAE